MEYILYRETGYKYDLPYPYYRITSIKPEEIIVLGKIKLLKNGLLHLDTGFGWDGPTGMIDTTNLIRASAEHDAFYRLIRWEKLDQRFQRRVDIEFIKVAKKDGVNVFRRWYALYGLKKLGYTAISKESRLKVLRAP